MNETLIGILSVSVLIFMYNVLWKDYCIDLFRENLFEIRNNLFCLAAESEKEFHFNHPLYLSFENAINGSIIVAEDINLLELIFVDRHVKKHKIVIDNILSRELKDFVDKCQDGVLSSDVESLKNEFDNSIIRFLIGGSFFVGLSFIAISFIKQCFSFEKRKIKYQMKKNLEIPLVEFENQAQNFGYALAA